MLNILCIGAGVMSSAFAIAEKTKHNVSILPAPFDQDIVTKIQAEGRDPRLDLPWPGIPFVDTKAKDFDLIVVGVSSLGIPWAVQIIDTLFNTKKVPVLVLTKGLMEKDGKLWLISDYIESATQAEVVSVSGPCIASLLAKQHNTEVILSAKDIQKHQDWIQALELPFYTFQTTEDYIGTAWASALKNVYAILIGKEKNNGNAESARFSEALSEMKDWIVEQGGKAETVYGLAGSGDLYVTCQGGRNGQLGGYLADGLTVSDVLEGPMKGVTVEGVDLARVIMDLADYQNKPLFGILAQLLDQPVR